MEGQNTAERGVKLGRMICEHLGLPPNLVKGLTIRVTPTQPVEVFVEAIVRGDTGSAQWREIVQGLKQPHLVIELYDADRGVQLDPATGDDSGSI